MGTLYSLLWNKTLQTCSCLINLYRRPIEAITVTVHLEEIKIIYFQDRFMIPVPKAAGTNYRESNQRAPFDHS
ncbi:hypothetical protein CRYUN_Cryun18bG0040400 [Craigia yunnanensis]